MEIITGIVCLSHTIYTSVESVYFQSALMHALTQPHSVKYTTVSCLAKAHYLNHHHHAKSIPITVLAHAQHLEVCNGP